MKGGISDAYVVDAIRTPLGRRNGTLKSVHPVDLLAGQLNAIIARNGVPPEGIEDVIIGCVSQIGEQGADIARNAILSAGLPESIPGTTVDRQCGSSLQAIQFAIQGVQSGFYDLVIAGGVESMSRVAIGSNISQDKNPITESLGERYSLNGQWFSQAYGAELIAKKYGFKREELDEFGFRSHKLAASSRDHFRKEIVPVKTGNNQGGAVKEVELDFDEGVRPDTTLEKMMSLPPAFKGLDLITAGNSSQITDGASATLIASERAISKYDLKPLARFLSFSVVGVDPVTMLTGPIPATKKALDRAGLTKDQIDIYEVNEAFSPVPLAWLREFDVPVGKLNPHGGAIAIGHPLGATGSRLVATILNGLRSSGGKLGLIAVCEGGGMANSAVVELV